jgi:hypothetical protein
MVRIVSISEILRIKKSIHFVYVPVRHHIPDDSASVEMPSSEIASLSEQLCFATKDKKKEV